MQSLSSTVLLGTPAAFFKVTDCARSWPAEHLEYLWNPLSLGPFHSCIEISCLTNVLFLYTMFCCFSELSGYGYFFEQQRSHLRISSSAWCAPAFKLCFVSHLAFMKIHWLWKSPWKSLTCVEIAQLRQWISKAEISLSYRFCIGILNSLKLCLCLGRGLSLVSSCW